MYNFLCSALSLYSLAVVIKSFYHGGLLYTFAMVPDPNVKHAFFIYWITKHLELLDTVFMILRHRQRQITFLHVSLNFGVKAEDSLGLPSLWPLKWIFKSASAIFNAIKIIDIAWWCKILLL